MKWNDLEQILQSLCVVVIELIIEKREKNKKITKKIQNTFNRNSSVFCSFQNTSTLNANQNNLNLDVENNRNSNKNNNNIATRNSNSVPSESM